MVQGLRELSPSVPRLFSLIPPGNKDWSPGKKMRTLIEVANHLAQIPSIDLTILQGSSETEVQEMERTLFMNNRVDLTSVWEGGLDAIEQFYGTLPTEEYHTRICKAFYGYSATPEKWLLDIITHGYHHRSQLFTYLKILEAPVDMSTLYS
jgi:uncharacterized damage-inducible protein DinB